MIILTHNDFDGVTAAIVGKVCFPDAIIDFCNYDNIDKKAFKYIGQDMICITDISVNKDTANYINNFNKDGQIIKLFDHHKSAEWLFKYDWAYFDINKCGAKIFYDWLCEIDYYKNILKRYEDLVKYADDYDRWQHKYPHSKKLNMLVYEYGLERFTNRFLKDSDCCLTKTEELILELAEERKQKHLKKMKRDMLLYKNNNNENVAVFLSTKFAGEVRDYINDDNIDYYMFFDISNGIASIRCKEGRDCTIIAKKFSGGGHKGAAGFQFKFNLNRFLSQFNLIK